MKKNTHPFIALSVGICILAAQFAGCSPAGRYSQRNPNQGSTLQGRNLMGENLRVDPNAGPKTGTLGGTAVNPGTGTRFGIRTSPGTGITPGINKISNQTTQPSVFDTQKASNIKTQLAKIPGLQNLTVIVSGNTALVGYASTGTVEDKEGKKNTVSNKIKQIDKSITNVMIGDSSEIATQIGRLSNDITNNRPANELVNRFNQLVQGLRPR